MRTFIRCLAFAAIAAVTLIAAQGFGSFIERRDSFSGDPGPEWYAAMWQKTDSLVGIEQPKSALHVVMDITRRAAAERNRPQVVRCTAYRVGLSSILTEDGARVLIDELEREVRSTRTQPEKAIYQSMLATMYARHFARFSWRIQARSEVADTVSDFTLWSARRFADTTCALFLASLSAPRELQAEPISAWKEILIPGSDDATLRPTLYDILAHRAVEYFQGDSFSSPASVDAFELRELSAFAPASAFITSSFPAQDPCDRRAVTLRLFQDLLRFHAADTSAAARVDVDLERLTYVRQECTHPDKDTAYFQALTAIAGDARIGEHAALAGERIASYHFEHGDLVAAYNECDTWIARFPGSRGAVNCRALQADILQPELMVAVERTTPPARPLQVSVRYRNISSLHLRIVRDDLAQDDRYPGWERYGRDREDRVRELLGKPVIAASHTTLPDARDYAPHVTDVQGAVLPVGRYVLIASVHADFALDSNFMVTTPFTVTRLGCSLQRNNSDGTITGIVTDAQTGTPLEGVHATLFRWGRHNDNRVSHEAVQRLTSDRNGFLSIPNIEAPQGLSLVLVRGDDSLRVQEGLSVWREPRHAPQTRTMFFTDRAIYRPGQLVHFKGVMLTADADSVRYTVQRNVKSTVVFYDANWQKVAEQSFTTNDFGSFSGTFTIPAGALTGRMRISNGTGAAMFRVEEYKRPTFEVTHDEVKSIVALDAQATVRGRAMTFSGAPVDGGKVDWRVVRAARFPYWGWWWRPAPISPELTVASGTTQTRADGSFEIGFTAIPDRKVPKDDLPVFTFFVYTSVTDINGESHSGRTTLNAGYTAVEIAAGVPGMVDVAALPRAVLTARTINGAPIAIEGNVRLEKLRLPARVVRTRLLPQPDLWTLEADAYHTAFPDDAWKDEGDQRRYPVERTALDVRVRTDTAGVDSLALGRLEPGRYRLTFTVKDPGGRTLEQHAYFTAFDATETHVPEPVPAFMAPLKVDCKPGDTASFLFGTGYTDANVLYQLEVRGRIVAERWIEFDGTQRRFDIPITEGMRGGITARLVLVRAHRMLVTEVPIAVPWTNKELRIETATFRDKLTPGAQEEWRITVRGENGAVVAAEMIASMYDASLDAVIDPENPRPHRWQGFSWPSTRTVCSFMNDLFTVSEQDPWGRGFADSHPRLNPTYPGLNLFVLEQVSRGSDMRLYSMAPMMAKGGMDGAAVSEVAITAETPQRRASVDRENEAADETGAAEAPSGPAQVRRNFNETAFFFPQLAVDAQGDVVLRFTMPEALTRWRFMTWAHTADLMTGSIERTAVSQKDLMVVPNLPRFLRTGDDIAISAKVVSLAGRISGKVRLELFDAVTMQPLDARFGLVNASHPFQADQGASAATSWQLQVPEGLTAIVYRITAQSGTKSDGEEAALPVLPDRMLVTETLPLWVRGAGERSFRFDKLVTNNSTTLRQQSLVLEMTSNPAWYAVQALPLLMEFPHECSEQVFNRIYADALATYIVQKDPKIRRVFDLWRGGPALESNLSKNQDLKSVLLAESPWVLAAQDETERKKRVGLLFDLNAMGGRLAVALRKLEQAQDFRGGWPWFPGMPPSRHITQYILAGFGHLHALGVTEIDARTARMIERAISYVDAEMQREYDELRKRTAAFDAAKDWLSPIDIQYLHARSYFLRDHPVGKSERGALDFWLAQARRYWPKQGLMSQGMIALALTRFNDASTPRTIITSLRERALTSEEMGMYWKHTPSWYWYQAPIETQAVLIEAFDEIARDRDAVEAMRVWLLRQKQVQDWKTTIATSEATYALLRRGTDLLASDKLVDVRLGGERVDPAAASDAVEAGTGSFRHTWSASEITPKLGEVTLRKSDHGLAWGALYWQYYEKLDKITPARTPLLIEKRVYRQATTARGLVLEPITGDKPLRVGEVITLRLEIRTDRDMEYVHVKDMHGAGFDHMTQISRYQWQGSLGYYEAPRDASMNFFVHRLPKGVHVLEYSLRVTHAGVFSNGISTIQCMYAPEFASHTAGIALRVE